MPDRRLIEFARRMRHEQTPAEEAMWRLLRNRRAAGYKFRRQHPVGRYIADFFAACSAVVIEVDGDTHATEEGIEYDRVRHAHLESLGLVVVRFWNTEVKENPEGILELVCELCEQRNGTHRRLLPREDRQKPTGGAG